ncbi:LytR/AlgR family response regulator transcription factor [Pedobacter duraquae]|uniref:LytTR family two component transcriptional regulator n=1 Tax=Pedobacter duraquae TaxID=425511 RepID=A0A4V3C433_9SPHI|nr:LytTR family transcriptional regulator DNA-binding domain-containing protein [Pedobacter duraquae]TDO24408.1 LytTR family two component transcriptional regulator [Pedobacter duraquae]
MIKTILIDDEPLARDIVRYYLKEFPEIAIVAECSDGFEGVKAIAQFKPDLIFLDIQMPKINGFEMMELLEHRPAVIFTTAFDEFAIKAFEVNAVDYLLKPIEQQRFRTAIQKLSTRLASDETEKTAQLLSEVSLNASQRNRVVVKKEGVIKIIATSDIRYLEANDDYVKISTAEGSYQKNKTMSFFEKTLDPEQFIRIHRSYLINMSEVTKIELKEKESYVVLLKSGIWLPVSKSGYVKLKQALGI